MDNGTWIREFLAAVIVCNSAGVILAMNDTACGSFEKEGGAALIGTNLLDCHPEPARTKVTALLKSRSANIYTIEKAGIKKLIYQAPWYDDGKYAGFVELSLPIPKEMPHFNRDIQPSQ
jgi:sensor histidine kinase regulating citrate/malate metabolism